MHPKVGWPDNITGHPSPKSGVVMPPHPPTQVPTPMADRREKMSLRLGKQMLKNINHRQLFPPTRESISGRRTRYMQMLQPFRCGARLRKSAVPHITTLLNADIQLQS